MSEKLNIEQLAKDYENKSPREILELALNNFKNIFLFRYLDITLVKLPYSNYLVIFLSWRSSAIPFACKDIQIIIWTYYRVTQPAKIPVQDTAKCWFSINYYLK